MKNSASRVFLGFLAGAAVGAALGILFAPAKGEETRKKIKEKINYLEEKFKNELEPLEDEDALVED